MKMILNSLFAVAAELGEMAKNSMPKIREGEVINREWFEDGVYYRETAFNGEIYLVAYDFRSRAIIECSH